MDFSTSFNFLKEIPSFIIFPFIVLMQVEYPADGAVSEIILPDDVELLSYLSTDYEPIPADEQEQAEILHQTYSEQSAAATGLYVKASADFTAQLVYTDSDGS